MNLKRIVPLYLLLAILSLAGFGFCDEKLPVNTPKPFCNEDILLSYGLDGNKFPVKMELEMCPTISESCCQVKDQLTIYSNWVHGQEENNLHGRFKYIYNLYAFMMDEVIRVMPIAKMITEKLKNKKVSNCKVLARKILHFQIKDIAPKLKEAVRTMHEFFFTSYKGMYCMLCDAYTHQYFRLKQRRLIFGERFCRDITANSLHVLLYFHLHFAKFLNLVGTFLSTCDNRGRFNEKGALPAVYTFHTSQKARDEVEKCKTFRNDPTWFKMCKPLCENFKLTKFVHFFQPHLKKYRMYAEFINARIKHIKVLEKNDPLNQKMTPVRILQTNNKFGRNKVSFDPNYNSKNVKSSIKIKPDGRILAASKPAKPAKPAQKTAAEKSKAKAKKKGRLTMVEKLKLNERKYKRLGIYRSSLNAIIPIDAMKTLFEDPGIELLSFGEASLIDHARYEQVNNFLKKTKKVKTVERSGGLFGNGVSVLNSQILFVFALATLAKIGLW